MPALLCPGGHESSDIDFCSVCGVKLRDSGPFPNLPCPDCSTPRDAGGAVYCEICGFNFITGAHGELRPMPRSAEPAWNVQVEIESESRDTASPAPPASFEGFSVPVHPGSVLIGRSSERRAIIPDVALDHDDAVSHRHALLTHGSDGSLIVRDLESVNGTLLNGAPLTPLADVELHAGDILALGHWTRLRLVSAP